MYNVLSITIPFFAIIFLGIAFRAFNFFDNFSSKILTKFALYITLPPFIFTNIIKSHDKVIFNWDFIIRFEIITIFILILSYIISKTLLKNSKKESSLFALNSAYPNYGYMGIPLCILAFGDSAAIPISIILLFDTLVLLSFTSYIIYEGKNHNLLKEIFNILIDMIKNPILLSAFIGFLFLIFDIKLNLILFRFLDILAFAASPTALFALGITLWIKIDKSTINQVSIISFLKLSIHPFLIFCIFYIFPSEIPKIWINVAILCSCLPIAGNVFAMSIYYNSYIKITSSSILLTTILSTITVPVMLFFLL